MRVPRDGSLGVILHLKGLGLVVRVVGDGQAHRMQDGHDTGGVGVQVTAQAVLQEGVFHGGVRLGHANLLGEVPDGGGGVASAAQAADGRHPGVVPAGHIVLLHQLAQLALGHNGVVDAQTGELDLTGLVIGNGDVVDDPVIQRTMGLKLQGTQGMGDTLQGVLNGVSEVIHGIDAPLVAGAVVRHVLDAVDGRVAHIEVAAGQVDLGARGS